MSAVLEAQEPRARYLVTVQPALGRQFDLLSTAPGSVGRLRELVMTLAVQGKLVPQIADDEPAQLALKRARAAKSKLVAMSQMGRDKPTQPINEDDALFDLPSGWARCRLGELGLPQAGFAFKSAGFNESKEGLPLIRIRDVGSSAEPSTFFLGEYRQEFLVGRGDWLISMDGEFRVRRWHGAAALLNQRVARLIFAADELYADFIAAAVQRELTALQGVKAYTTVDHLGSV